MYQHLLGLPTKQHRPHPEHYPGKAITEAAGVKPADVLAHTRNQTRYQQAEVAKRNVGYE